MASSSSADRRRNSPPGRFTEDSNSTESNLKSESVDSSTIFQEEFSSTNVCQEWNGCGHVVNLALKVQSVT